MSIIQAAGAGETSTGFYPHTIDNSLRFGDGDVGYLSRTFGTPTETTIGSTLSGRALRKA